MKIDLSKPSLSDLKTIALGLSDVDEVDLLSTIRALADHGLSFLAFPVLERLLALPQPEAHTLAARVMRHVGGHRHSDATIWRLLRKYPDHPQVALDGLRTMIGRKGLYRGWLFYTSTTLQNPSRVIEAEWLALGGWLFSQLRDDQAAEEAYNRALELEPENPWVWVEYGHGLEAQDRYDEAVKAMEQALEINPYYRAAIQGLAHLYTLVGRDDEGLQLMKRMAPQLQSCDMWMQLAGIMHERQQFEREEFCLNKGKELAPLADKLFLKWVESRRVDSLIAQGRLDEAHPLCVALGDPASLALAERLQAEGAKAKHVFLPVGFVRQHHMTCAPATLSALSLFWGKQAEHLDVAEKICYDGTSLTSERAWAEEQGFIATEFTVRWEVACALLNAGIPFTLATVGTNSGHLQAVVGYDTLQQALLIRDPFMRIHKEFNITGLLEGHRSSGPRGMILLPQEQAYRLDGIELPDAAHWTVYYQLMRALDVHERAAAGELARKQIEQYPEHRLTLCCEKSLAYYDGDYTRVLSVNERQLALFSDDTGLMLERAHMLGQVSTQQECLSWLEKIVADNPWNPALLTRLAQQLLEDARQHEAAQKHLRRALYVHAQESSAWAALADATWGGGQKSQAVHLYRIAACLNRTSEHLALKYMRACSGIGRVTDGLTFLKARVQKLVARSSDPLISYFEQLDLFDQADKAFAELERGLQQRPNDTSLFLFAAEKYLNYGDLEKAKTLLEQAKGPAREAERLRVLCQVARQESRFDDAWDAIRQACELEPLNIPLQRLAARTLAQREGRKATVAYLRACIAQHNRCIGLLDLLLEWLDEALLTEIETVLRQILEVNPRYARIQRDLALNLGRQKRMPEAWDVIRLATELAPQTAASYSVQGYLHELEGQVEQAQECFRQTIRLSIDNDYACNALIRGCTTYQERLAAVNFVHEQIVEQTTDGDVFLQFLDLADNTLTPEQLLDSVREMQRHRPELWQSWTALAQQLMNMEQYDEALTVLEEAQQNFPLLPRLFYEKARVQSRQKAYATARDTLRRALQLSPAWLMPIRLFVHTIIEEKAPLIEALELLDSPLSRSHEHPEWLYLRGKVLGLLERTEEALQQLQAAIEVAPGYESAWSLFAEYAQKSGDSSRSFKLALELCEKQPGEVEAWIKQAAYADDLETSLTALDRALVLEPRNQQAFCLRLDRLINASRYDDALAKLAINPWGKHAPTSVRRYRPRLVWRQGDQERALDEIRALLQEEPNHYGIWQELADWLDQLDRNQEYANATNEMLRINASSFMSHGYVAHAALKLNERDVAIKHFTQAYAADPEYGFAGHNLVDLLLPGENWPQVEPIIQQLRQYSPGPYVALAEIRYAIRAKDKDRVVAPLEEALCVRGDYDSVAKQAIELVRKQGWRSVIKDVAKRCAENGTLGQVAANYWLKETFSAKSRDFVEKIAPLLEADRHLDFTCAALQFIADEGVFTVASTLSERYQERWRADPRIWGMVGYVLVTGDHHEKIVAWMHDWKREDAPAWALDNLVLALQSQANFDQARWVADRALALNPENHDAMIWLATDAARQNDMSTLKQWLERTRDLELRPFYKNLRDVLHAYTEVMTMGRHATWRHIRARFRQTRDQSVTLDRLLTDLQRQILATANGWRKILLWIKLHPL